MKKLTNAQIEELAGLPNVKRRAVENFLITLDGQTQAQALQNAKRDAHLYKWSKETQAAIQRGIRMTFS